MSAPNMPKLVVRFCRAFLLMHFSQRLQCPIGRSSTDQRALVKTCACMHPPREKQWVPNFWIGNVLQLARGLDHAQFILAFLARASLQLYTYYVPHARMRMSIR